MQQRQCVILEGEHDWCEASSQVLLKEFSRDSIIYLSNHSHDDCLSISQKQAQQQLGKEFDAVIFDGLTVLNPDSLGAMMGTIKQGGVLILWLNTDEASVWLQRFKRISEIFSKQHDSFHIVQQGQTLPQLAHAERQPQSTEVYWTNDQQQAVEAIIKVVHGHRRRPLVLSADRGRGKSASLGIAAAQLLNEGRQTILVTAPSLAVAKTVFKHASRLLPEAESTAGLIMLNNAEIRFVPPDMLIESDFKADLVLIDEAAVIPVSMLDKLLQKYSRIVFSTTLHGYEGTGRGFAVRFHKILDEETPDWRSYKMETPIRWSGNDLLEQFSFESLLLNAVPVKDELISAAIVKHCDFEYIEQQSLINNEQNIRDLFGLMVLAHYRTRPSDLKMMLNSDDISIYVMRYQGHIVASAWLVKEGQLDDELSSDIYNGTRRLKGHLLPQSLLAHAGISSAGGLKYQRVIRIATHPKIQNRGIGKALLDNIIKQVDCDVVGASFGADRDVINFWSQAGFTPVRLGFHNDDVTASHAIMMLKANSQKGRELTSVAIDCFQRQWPHLLQNQFSHIASDIVIQLSQLLPLKDPKLTPRDKQEIDAFATQQRTYESCQTSLWIYISSIIRQPYFSELTEQQQQLCVMLILQQNKIIDVIKKLSYTGKSQLILSLRQTISELLANTFLGGK